MSTHFFCWYCPTQGSKHTSDSLGKLLLTSTDHYLDGLHFENNSADILKDGKYKEVPAPFKDICNQLDEYFRGERTVFDIPIMLNGTKFQKKVWEALQGIPYAQTVCYQEIANIVGSPKGYRAVGLANNKNPISIIIPCHRVIGKNGSLVGFGGGLEKKQFLLDLESRNTHTT